MGRPLPHRPDSVRAMGWAGAGWPGHSLPRPSSQPEKEKEALEVVSRNMTKIEEILIKSLSNVLQPKNIALIRSTLAFLKVLLLWEGEVELLTSWPGPQVPHLCGGGQSP